MDSFFDFPKSSSTDGFTKNITVKLRGNSCRLHFNFINDFKTYFYMLANKMNHIN